MDAVFRSTIEGLLDKKKTKTKLIKLLPIYCKPEVVFFSANRPPIVERKTASIFDNDKEYF